MYDDKGESIRAEWIAELTILYGRSGTTLWHRKYPGFVASLVISDGMLVVGHETGEVINDGMQGEAGTRSALLAYTFAAAGDALVATERWRLSTGASWGRWLAMEPVPG